MSAHPTSADDAVATNTSRTEDTGVGAPNQERPAVHEPLGRAGDLRGAPSAVAIAAGLLIAASLPPWGWWPSAFVGLALLDRLLAEVPWRTRFKRGTLVGLALFTPTVVWISQLTVPGYVIATLLFAAMVGGFCAAVPPGSGRRPALVGVWVLCESLRSAWPFGGVPLSLLAVGQVGGPLAPIARVGGVLAIATATVLVGLALSAGVSALASDVRRDRWVAALCGVAVAALLGVAQVAPSGNPTGETLAIALVQGGGPQGTRAINTDKRAVFERHLDASAEVPDGMDLVLWPEDVVDSKREVQKAKEGEELEDLAAELDATLVVGTVEGVSDTHWRNSSQVVTAEGEWVDRYVKVQRVPFGEVVPFRSFVERFAPDTLAKRDALTSNESGLLQTPEADLATVISWEVFFGHRVRSAVGAGGELIYNPTNGATYTGTFVQTQQVASSRLRAIETGRWLVQVSPTGFSAFITDSGEVLQRTGTVERAVRVHEEIPLRTGETLYTRWGDLPPRAAAVLLLAAGWALHHRRRTVTGSTPAGE